MFIGTMGAWASALAALQAVAGQPPIKPTVADPDWTVCTGPKDAARSWRDIIIICDRTIAANRQGPQQMARAYYYRGNAHVNLTENAAALNDYFQAIKLDPGFAKAYNNIGYVFKSQGHNDAARNYFSKAIALNPSDATFFQNRGTIYGRLGKWDEAALDFSDAIRLNPSDQAIYYNRGLARYNTYQWGSASTDFQQALRLDPNDADAQRMLAQSQTAIGRAASMQQALNRQREDAERMRQAEAARQRDMQLAQEMLGAVLNSLVAAAQPAAPRPNPGYAPPAPSYSGQSYAPAAAAPQPTAQTGQPGTAKSTYLNPATGKACVTATFGPNVAITRTTGQVVGTRYGVTFTNSCNRSFSVKGRIVPVSSQAIMVRGTGVGARGTTTVTCSDNDGKDSCRGFADAWVE